MSYKLCYVRDGRAYFTTQELALQTGSDWDDAPYEHNSGLPQTGSGWEILSVFYVAPLDEACVITGRRLSVDDINDGSYPWLSQGWRADDIRIYAGTTIDEFIALIDRLGGTVYLPHNQSILP